MSRVPAISQPNQQSRSKFSVIVTNYNLGTYLPEAVNSVLSQTVRDTQLIVVDDASDDPATLETLDLLESPIEVVRLPRNGGIGHARNVGLARARGPYVLCLDADDYIDPGYLEKAADIFDNDPSAGIVSCHVRAFGSQNWDWQPREDIALAHVLADNPLPIASCFRLSAADGDTRYDECIQGYEDWDLWIKLLEKGWKVRVIPATLFHYRKRPDSFISESRRNDRYLELITQIVDNHREAYESNLAEVLTVKHRQVDRLREQRYRFSEQNSVEIEKYAALSKQHDQLSEQYVALSKEQGKLETSYREQSTELVNTIQCLQSTQNRLEKRNDELAGLREKLDRKKLALIRLRRRLRLRRHRFADRVVNTWYRILRRNAPSRR